MKRVVYTLAAAAMSFQAAAVCPPSPSSAFQPTLAELPWWLKEADMYACAAAEAARPLAVAPAPVPLYPGPIYPVAPAPQVQVVADPVAPLLAIFGAAMLMGASRHPFPAAHARGMRFR